MNLRIAPLFLVGVLPLWASGGIAPARADPAPSAIAAAPVVRLRDASPEDTASINDFFADAAGPTFRLADYAATTGPWLERPLARRFEDDMRLRRLTAPWGILADINVQEGQSPDAFVVSLGQRSDSSVGYVVAVARQPDGGWKIARIGTYVI